VSTADRLASILDVLDLLRPGCTTEITPEAVAEARRAAMELASPLAESTTIVHPDDGDGPWVQPPRMAVPRGVVGSRVRVQVMGDEPGEE